MANSFCVAGKKALLDAVVSHTWQAALYTTVLSSSTAAYTSINEVASGNGYTTGGETLTGAATNSSGNTAWIDFDDVSWATASFTARSLLIYDASDSNRAYAVIDFGSDKTGQGGAFTYQMPAPDATHAQIRL